MGLPRKIRAGYMRTSQPWEKPGPTGSQMTFVERLRRLVGGSGPGSALDARRASPATLAILLGPALLIYAAFTVYPVLRTFWNSIHTIKPQNVLPPVAGHQHQIGGEARTFDVNVQALAASATDGDAAGIAAAFGPLSGDLILRIGRELAGEIEIIAVAGAAQLQIEFTLAAAALAVGGDATDTFRGVAAGPDGSVSGPTPAEIGKRSGSRQCGQQRDGESRDQGDEPAAEQGGGRKQR